MELWYRNKSLIWESDYLQNKLDLNWNMISQKCIMNKRLIIFSLYDLVIDFLLSNDWWWFVCFNKDLYTAQGALVNSVGMDCTGISGGLICAYSLSAAFCEGFQFKGKTEPNRRCWTTGNLPRTSFIHILYIPLQILLQDCDPLISYNIGLVS